jgi:hypothetical protein
MLRHSVNIFTSRFYWHSSVCLHSARKIKCILSVSDFLNLNLSGSGLNSSNKFVIPSMAVDLPLFALFLRNHTTVTRINKLNLVSSCLKLQGFDCMTLRKADVIAELVHAGSLLRAHGVIQWINNIIIIIFINCNWVDTRWQWLFYMYTKYDIDYY